MNSVCDFTASLVEWKWYGLYLYQAAKLPPSCLASSPLAGKDLSGSLLTLVDESAPQHAGEYHCETALTAVIEHWRAHRRKCSYGLGLSVLRSAVTARSNNRNVTSPSRGRRPRLLTLVPVQTAGTVDAPTVSRAKARHQQATDDDISWLVTSKNPQGNSTDVVDETTGKSSRRRSSVADTSTAAQILKTRKIISTREPRKGKKHPNRRVGDDDNSFATASAERLMAWQDTSMSRAANISFGRGITVEGPSTFLKRTEKGADHLALVLGATPDTSHNVEHLNTPNHQHAVAVENAVRKGGQILAELSTLVSGQRPSSKK